LTVDVITFVLLTHGILIYSCIANCWTFRCHSLRHCNYLFYIHRFSLHDPVIAYTWLFLSPVVVHQHDWVLFSGYIYFFS